MRKFPAKLRSLYFDPKNPRLPANFGEDQPKIFRYLINDIGVEDLIQSIATSGLFNADPIIVRKRPAGGYYVVEGNRRLAALKLLNGETPNDQLPNPTVPEVSPALKESFKTIPVESGWPAEQLQAYLGYKHVTAAREWLPEAKAKFVFENAKGDFSDDNLRKFAKTVGTNLPTLKRWLVAYFTMRQAEREGFFDSTDTAVKNYFGTFYTLLGGSQAREFLKLKTDTVGQDPVPKDRLRELSDFISWTIGTKDKPASVNSRKQAQFEQILASPRALEHFRVKGDIEASLLYTEYNAEQITKVLREAAYSVEACLTQLFDVRQNVNVRDAFAELERAYRKARLNMKADESPPEEE
jgi:hypothetical protein